MSDSGAETDTAQKPAASVSPSTRLVTPTEEDSPPTKPVPFLDDVLNRMENLLDILNDPEHVPRNILLVGQPRAGKSAFINLIHSSMRGRFEAIVESGSSHSGESGSLTYHLRFFPNLGLSNKYMNDFRERYKDKLPKDFHLPTIIDMPGIEVGADVIKYILCGAVSHNTELHEFMTEGKITPDLDLKNAVARQIDRVVFVASIKDDVQEKIFKDIVTAVRGSEGKMRSIPYYLVLTHVDEAHNPRSDEENAVVNTLLDVLFLRGESKIRVSEVVNYTDKDEPDPKRINAYATDLEKHAQGLTVLCKVLARREVIIPREVETVGVNEMTAYVDYTKRKAADLYQYLRGTSWSFLFYIFLLVVGVLVGKIFHILSSLKN